MFRKVLVANRGEIAVRVVRALRELDITSVAVFSDIDRGALHVRLADEAERVENYLSIESILDAARRHDAEAIHPGYGFLSENSTFAAACEAAGIVFIGPSADAIRRLGSKTAARTLAKQMNVPVVPGSEEPATHLEHARELARRIGYPVLLKAAAGGGGKGMRRVDRESELEAAIRDASSEAERAFKSSEVYIEKVIEQPRHIEIQVAGDHYGHLVHLGERECSLQRRHQKIIEECPSPFVAANPEMRAEMGEAAVRVARAVGYYNLGTVEFLADAAGNFYFLEVNTRLQVEHPVTELVTGLDLVHLQLRIACGEAIPFTQEDVRWRGWAMECRICAEDPEQNFFPSPGKIAQLREPAGPAIRLDSGVYPGWTVPIDYDPLLAKLVAWGPDRMTAIRRLLRALEEYAIVGVETNVAFFSEILKDPQFREGKLDTGFVAEFFKRRPRAPETSHEMELVAALAAAAQSRKREPETRNQKRESSRWLSEGRSQMLR
ncbi:MAG TPA: acetyl-CoA carboxylase biotin carboxylase subunit [Bryobacteraceae bacterium]|nr:acetyl-CoA carboxylase biotin carboxylase subunit [Bryobacteraceae bacterium]